MCKCQAKRLNNNNMADSQNGNIGSGPPCKLTLGEAGIDTSLYKSHSTRAASTSAASKSLDISYILKAASLKKAATFRRYYHRELVKFGAAVLDTA